MVDHAQPAPRSARLTTAIGIGLLATGAVALLLAIGFDLHGFGGGLMQGTSVGTMLVGTYLWGFANGSRRAQRRLWLPSRGTAE